MAVRMNSVVMVPRDGQVWPGRVVRMGQEEAEVKLYRQEKTQTFKIDQLSKFSIDLAAQHEGRPSKEYTTACKQARKDLIKDQTSYASSRKLEVKEEQDNCKQQQQEERERQGVQVSYPSLHAFLCSQNQLAVMEDCKEERQKEYQYICMETGETITVLKTPRYVLVVLLTDLLQGAITSRSKIEKINMQKRVACILSAEILTCEDCLKSKIMKWVGHSIARLSQQDETGGAAYLQELRKFEDRMRRQFLEKLCDYRGVAELVPLLRVMSLNEVEG